MTAVKVPSFVSGLPNMPVAPGAGAAARPAVPPPRPQPPVTVTRPAPQASAPAVPRPAAQPVAAQVVQPAQAPAFVPAPAAGPMVPAQPAPPPASFEPPAGPALLTEEAQLADVWGQIEEFGAQITHLRDVIPRAFIATESTKGFTENRWTKGLWTHRGTAEQKRSLKLVMAFVVESRAMRQAYDPSAPEQRPPVCVSLDANKGLGSDEHDGTLGNNAPTALANNYTHVGPFDIYPGTDCSLCRWSQWQGKGQSRKKPACGEEFTIVGLDEDWGPVVVTFRSTGIAPLRKFKSAATHKWMAAKERAAVKRPLLRRLPSQFFGVAIIETEEVKKAGSVPYFVPVFKWSEVPEQMFGSATDPAFISMLSGLRDQLRTVEGMLDAGDVPDDGDEDRATSFNPEEFEAPGQDGQWNS